MARTLMDLLKPEIDEEIRADRKTNLFTYAQKGGMTVDFAAKEVGMSVTDFIASMQKAGYTVPETA